ncbi:Uroporphyrinogen-III methyltransferase [Acidisarcina polymorpha]|uniref:Uroporphyrinogen-III synthase n=1 Tax=Acidisarcina polymorpha TaxID=2211140 RepID=A0A2Z5G919_9BACT|nr:uroporphyrinogen-III synthase [Acidisarcina polymorpha]AXC15046.1 Uroporphyrinogen-III methyltransferase [Acidisarcina polymorpha]
MSEPSPKPLLEGRRIIVTRARTQASSLVTSLQELGAEVIEIPTIETIPLDSYEMLDDALKNIANYQWLLVTSANTVRVLAERLAVLKLSPSTLDPPQKVAIGSATARAMREQGIAVDLIPEQYVAESLVSALGDQVAGSRILLARAAIARDLIPEALARQGATVDIVDAYRTVLPEGSIERIQQVFASPARLPDAITFTSSSTVKNFFTLWNEAGFSGIPKEVAALSIGPITSQTLREHGWEPAREAKRHDVEGLVDATVRYVEVRILEEREREGYLRYPEDLAEAETWWESEQSNEPED